MTIRLNREQSRQVDGYAIHKLGLPGIVLMENAGRGCVDALLTRVPRPVAVVLCGPGNNGGDGFVIARHLMLRGHQARVIVAGNPDRVSGDAATNLHVWRKLGGRIEQIGGDESYERIQQIISTAAADANTVVDALLGTGARGELRKPVDSIVSVANELDSFRVAIDIPSGLDCDTGQPADVTFRADLTCTMVSEKTGFESEQAWPFLGEIEVVSIGVPQSTLTKNVSGFGTLQ